MHAIALLRESMPSAAAPPAHSAPAHAAAAHASAGAAGSALASPPSLPTSSAPPTQRAPPCSRSAPPQPAGARTATRASGLAGSGWAAALRDARFVGAGLVHAAKGSHPPAVHELLREEVACG